jgi:hypothetical protein
MPKAGITAHQSINYHHLMLCVGFAALQGSALARLQLAKATTAQHNQVKTMQTHGSTAQAVATKVCRLTITTVVHGMKLFTMALNTQPPTNHAIAGWGPRQPLSWHYPSKRRA